MSHAVAKVEQHLGYRVFDRSPAGVILTEAGLALFESVEGPLRQLDQAVREATQIVADRGAVTLSVSTSLASWWLLSRLPRFKQLHPDIVLRVVTSDADAGVGLDDADVWIPLGLVADSTLVATELCAERIVAVAAPALASLKSISDPVHAVNASSLLHLEERYAPRFDWRRWFAHHGDELPAARPRWVSNDYSLVLQAALDGQGVALGWLHIVSDLIEDGRLAPIGNIIETGAPFQILVRRTGQPRASVALLCDWLRAEMERSGETKTA